MLGDKAPRRCLAWTRGQWRHRVLSTHFREQFPSVTASPPCPVTDWLLVIIYFCQQSRDFKEMLGEKKPDLQWFLVGSPSDSILQRESLNIKNITLLLSYLVLCTILFGLRNSTSSGLLYRVITISAVCTAVRKQIRKCCSVALHMYCFIKRKVEDYFNLRTSVWQTI